jgi:membrane protease subunit HflK
MKHPIIIHAADPGPWGKPKGGSGGGNGGGGWTPGGRGPKGSGGGDLDDLLRDIKRQFHHLFGGDGNNHRGIVAGFALFFLLWLASGIYQLQPGEQGVVLRFGKFDRIASPGLRYHLPTPIESVEVVNVEGKHNETLGGDPNSPPHGGSSGTGDDEILMLTGDENIINVSFSVQWKVSDAQAYAFNIPEPQRDTVRAVTESAMREVIGKTPIEAAMTTGKSKISYETLKLSQQTLDRYKAGIQITDVNLLDASFPRAVVDAARDVQAAQADQESARNSAEGYTNDILPRARGKAERTVQEAEAYKQQVVAQAQGAAARFMSVYQQYKQAEDVTRKRIYLETMEKILDGTNKVILDGRGANLVPYLPLPELKPSSGGTDKGVQ